MRCVHRRLIMGALLTVGALTATSALVPASGSTPVGSEAAISTDAAYVKANGRPPGAGDAITACGTNRRQQNEPSVAVDPRNPTIVVAGSNDYCTVELAGGTWAGFYRSTNGGSGWTGSLLPEVVKISV